MDRDYTDEETSISPADYRLRGRSRRVRFVMKQNMNTPTARIARNAIRRLVDDSEIYDPRVRYEDGVQTLDGRGANLYLETFERSKADGTKWDSSPWLQRPPNGAAEHIR